jgi:hypothetical protein
MTFLELVQMVRQECGVAGTGPSTVVSQTGQLKKLVDWTNQAWRELQLRHDDWQWKRKDFTLSLAASDNDYSAADASITDFGEWDLETFRIYLTSASVSDETFLSKMDYDIWRNVWAIGSQTPSRPNVVALKPDQHLGFGPVPDDIYTVSGQYLQATQSMSLDADTPTGLPEEFHMIIVYIAMRKYAANEAAPEVWTNAKEEYKRMMGALERKQLPKWRTGPAAA